MDPDPGIAQAPPAPARAYVEDLPDRVGERVVVNGWLERIRRRKGELVLELRDRSGTVTALLRGDSGPTPLDDATPESAVSVTGTVHLPERPHGDELAVESVQLVAPAATPLPLERASATPDQRLEHRWLDLRARERYLVFAVQSALEQAMREFLHEQAFIELRTPKISGGGSESGASTFALPYFGASASLVQSPQFYMQMAMAAGFDRVYEIGPVFRSERGVTPRHATEFTIAHFEMSWIDSHHDLMDFEVRLLRHVLAAVADAHGDEIERRFGVAVELPPADVPRLALADAPALTGQVAGDTLGESGMRLLGRAEQALSKYAQATYGHSFVFLTDYPAEARPFYTMQEDADARPRVSRSFDLLWRGIELTSGGQREHRPQRLRAQVREAGLDEQAVASYLEPHFLEMFDYGCPPHGGFGIGVNRLLMALLAQPSLRETSFVFRGPDRFMP